ncbi:16S rRNA (uracil(1498)-N(3))-methyltransferase [Corynebacterium diphtheriae]|nr:16S rRNA (uracil(1498)-N(3))-methyltransferase [Corynebacterium diphtheriae]
MIPSSVASAIGSVANMSLPVFIYNLEDLVAGKHSEIPTGNVVLDGAEGRHAVSVKRMTAGEQIKLIDGRGGWATATVASTSGKSTLNLQVFECNEEAAPTPTVTVFQAIPKSERSELAVDLLTQGGADAIVPWEAHRCVAKWVGAKRSKGVLKWQQAAIAAAKQSRRTRIPEIAEPMTTAQIAEQLEQFDEVLVLHEDAAVPFATVDVSTAKSIALIIGPEGGVSPAEAEAFRKAGARAVKLGPEVLRTASAGIVALAALGVQTSRW